MGKASSGSNVSIGTRTTRALRARLGSARTLGMIRARTRPNEWTLAIIARSWVKHITRQGRHPRRLRGRRRGNLRHLRVARQGKRATRLRATHRRNSYHTPSEHALGRNNGTRLRPKHPGQPTTRFGNAPRTNHALGKNMPRAFGPRTVGKTCHTPTGHVPGKACHTPWVTQKENMPHAFGSRAKGNMPHAFRSRAGKYMPLAFGPRAGESIPHAFGQCALGNLPTPPGHSSGARHGTRIQAKRPGNPMTHFGATR